MIPIRNRDIGNQPDKYHQRQYHGKRRNWNRANEVGGRAILQLYPPKSIPLLSYYTPYSGLNGLDYSVAWDNFMRKTFSNQPGLTFTPSWDTRKSSYPLTYTIRPVDNPLRLSSNDTKSKSKQSDSHFFVRKKQPNMCSQINPKNLNICYNIFIFT